MRTLTAVAAVALTAATVVTMTAPGAAATPVPAAGGELRVFSLEPETLLPSDATDEPSIRIIRQLYSGLVDYDLDGTPVLDLAESIETTDNVSWVVSLRPGVTFQDGFPVVARSFVRAWQYAATGPNADLFDRIATVAEIDDLSFEVELTAPYGGFPSLLGHHAFLPLSESCLDGPEFCQEVPFGNGPYHLAGWEPGVGITLVRNESYPDPGQALPDTLEYRIYPDLATGCAAFKLGGLDVMYPIPPQCRPDVIDPLPGGYFTEVSNTFTQLGLPSYVPALDDPMIRQALSLAIDWSTIVDTVFDGRFTLAGGLVSPHTGGFRPGVCQVCGYDPVAAQALLIEAGGWTGGTLELWAPAGYGHESWLTMVGDQLHDALGIDYTLQVGLDLPAYLATAEAHGFTGPFWLDFDPDHPAMDAYLAPQFASGGPANATGYANPVVDELLDDGGAQLDPAAAIELYQNVEEVVLEGLPSVPMWFGQAEAVYSTAVDQFVWNAFTGPEYGRITLT